MFWRRKSRNEAPLSPLPDASLAPETIAARLDVIEARMSRVERRWAPGDQRELEAALAALGRAGGFAFSRDRERV